MQLAWLSRVGQWAMLLLGFVRGKFRAFMVWIISAGPIPSHIAFIMDGNRRFADRLHVDRRIGHSHGYDALLRTLKDCFDLHVKFVTLFAFSIDNFQRHPDEVSALMDLMQSKLETLIQKQGLASVYGIRVQILGDLRLLPEGTRLAAEKAMAVTKQNSSVVLNLCIAYTSTHEIMQAIQKTRDDFLAAYDVPVKPHVHHLCGRAKCHAKGQCNHEPENGNIATGLGFMQDGYGPVTDCEGNLENNRCNGGIADPVLHEKSRVHANGNGCSRIPEEEYFDAHSCYCQMVDRNVHDNTRVHANGNVCVSVLEKENLSEDELSSEDGIRAGSNIKGVSIRSSSFVGDNVSKFNGLKKDNRTKTQVSENFKCQDLPFQALCSPDMSFCTAACVNNAKTVGKVGKSALARNGCTQREGLVYETEHEEFHEAQEVVCSCTSTLSTPFGCSNKFPGNRYCHLHQFYSQNYCENEMKVQSLVTSGCNESLDTNDGIAKAVEDCVSEQKIERNMYTYPCPPPDILIRTSGETRLSNFLLWQTSFSHLAFCKVLWPEFSFRHLFFIILEYQQAYSSLLKKRQSFKSESWTHFHCDKMAFS